MIDFSIFSPGSKVARTFGNVARLLATLKLRPAQERQNTFGNVARFLATFFLSYINDLASKIAKSAKTHSDSEGGRKSATSCHALFWGTAPRDRRSVCCPDEGAKAMSSRSRLSPSPGAVAARPRHPWRRDRPGQPLRTAERRTRKLFVLTPPETTMGASSKE